MSNRVLLAMPWTPASLGPSLVAWWDPDYGITKDSVSNRISAWADRVAGTTVVQAIGAQQPLWVAAATEMNSRPSINFDLQPQSLRIASAPTSIRVQQQQNTYLAITRGSKDVLGTGGTSAGNMLLMYFGSKVRSHVWFASSLSTQDGLTTVGTTTRAMIGQMSDATKLYPILNGAKDNTGTNLGTATTAVAPFIIGWRGTGSTETFLGRMGDVLIFNRSLTDGELSSVYAWAKERWAL